MDVCMYVSMYVCMGRKVERLWVDILEIEVVKFHLWKFNDISLCTILAYHSNPAEYSSLLVYLTLSISSPHCVTSQKT